MDRSEQLLAVIHESGFADSRALIHLFVGGSELHGAKVKDTDDLDIYGTYLEPPELVLGLERSEFHVWSTAGSDRRNGPKDVDVCLYSLRKWAGLAAKGNPTALHFLFSTNYVPDPRSWQSVVQQRHVFLFRQAASQFRGFADAQLRRLQGIGTGKKGQRHELIGEHGYDIKAAMHAIRLLNEGIELMQSGTITLPRPEKDLLIEIRTGRYGSLERVLDLAKDLFAQLEKAEAGSDLPDSIDKGRISKLVSDTLPRILADMNSMATLYTIGHSTRTLDELITALNAHSIKTLVDIRAFPLSRRLPHFNRESLEKTLPEAGIQYIWMKELGGRRRKILGESPNIALRNDSFRNYADYMLTPKFEHAAGELIKLGEQSPTAYMCAERVYFQCHRMLVSDWLVAHGHEVLHIDDAKPAKPHKLMSEARMIDGKLLYRGVL